MPPPPPPPRLPSPALPSRGPVTEMGQQQAVALGMQTVTSVQSRRQPEHAVKEDAQGAPLFGLATGQSSSSGGARRSPMAVARGGAPLPPHPAKAGPSDMAVASSSTPPASAMALHAASGAGPPSQLRRTKPVPCWQPVPPLLPGCGGNLFGGLAGAVGGASAPLGPALMPGKVAGGGRMQPLFLLMCQNLPGGASFASGVRQVLRTGLPPPALTPWVQ